MARTYKRQPEPKVKVEAMLDASTYRMLEDLSANYTSRSEALRDLIRKAWQDQPPSAYAESATDLAH